MAGFLFRITASLFRLTILLPDNITGEPNSAIWPWPASTATDIRDRILQAAIRRQERSCACFTSNRRLERVFSIRGRGAHRIECLRPRNH
jgi:hypothetical protein